MKTDEQRERTDACSSRTERSRNAAIARHAELVTTKMVAFERLRSPGDPVLAPVR